MAIIPKQIGWSNESNLIWELLRKVDQLVKVTSTSGASSYKVYTALLNQSDNNAPVATVLENTIEGTMVWSRGGAGDYSLTNSSNPFSENTTFCFSSIGPNTSLGTDANIIFGYDNNDKILLNTLNNGIATDINENFYNNVYVEIRVYN